MSNLIKFQKIKSSNDKNDYLCEKIDYIQYDGYEPKDTWKKLVEIIKELQYNNSLSFDNLTDKLCHIDKYSDQICEGSDWIDYYIYIDYNDDVIKMTAYDADNYDNNIIVFENRYVTSFKKEGNCIDDFIKRGINPQIENIQDLMNSINKRLPERQVTTEYHRTYCYERDFTEISLIKKFAQKIVENCDTHLERISEFYTRL